MKTLFVMFIAGVVLWSCKPNNLSPDNKKTSNSNAVIISPPNPVGHGNLAGVWKWSAQYDAGYYEGNLLNPVNTGIQETLTLNNDSTWSQMQNGKVLNTGTYNVRSYITPAGPAVMLKLMNSLYPSLTFLDDFNFNKGFVNSYACSNDSMVFYGIRVFAENASIGTVRIYVK